MSQNEMIAGFAVQAAVILIGEEILDSKRELDMMRFSDAFKAGFLMGQAYQKCENEKESLAE